jgi:hypothetical protein
MFYKDEASRLEEFYSTFDEVKDLLISDLIEDKRWSQDPHTSIPRRGINDYNRYMTFSRTLSGEEISLLGRWAQADPSCPGWTGVSVFLGAIADENTSAERFVYRMRTTWDSSD